MKEITLSELRRHDGDQALSLYIAYQGIVYDVTNCPKWRSGLHEREHFAGQDLTPEMNDAPHFDEVFKHPCIKIIGKLIAHD